MTLVTRRCCTAMILAVGILSAWPAAIHAQPSHPDGESDLVNAERATRVLKQMQTLVHGLKVVDPDSHDPIKLIEEPLFRHNGLARSYEDGSTWAWGAKGRPVAFCKLFTFDSDEGFWHYCNTLTSTELVEMYRGDELVWHPESGAVVFKPIAEARSPAPTPAQRLRQMKELARRFSAHEVTYPPFSQEKTRHELELKPQPVHRYNDADQDIVDGAVFLIAHEAEPELILLIEAVKEGDKLFWQFAAAGIGCAEFHLALDGVEVYTRDWAKDCIGRPTEGYYGFRKHKDK